MKIKVSFTFEVSSAIDDRIAELDNWSQKVIKDLPKSRYELDSVSIKELK